MITRQSVKPMNPVPTPLPSYTAKRVWPVHEVRLSSLELVLLAGR